MPPGSPIAELPDEVTFTLKEAATLLFAADTAVERTTEGSAEHATARRAQRLITSRLRPDLGALSTTTRRMASNVDTVPPTDTQITVPEAARASW